MWPLSWNWFDIIQYIFLHCFGLFTLYLFSNFIFWWALSSSLCSCFSRKIATDNQADLFWSFVKFYESWWLLVLVKKAFFLLEYVYVCQIYVVLCVIFLNFFSSSIRALLTPLFIFLCFCMRVYVCQIMSFLVL